MKLEEYRKWEGVLIVIIVITLLYIGFMAGVGFTFKYPQQMYNTFIDKGETYIILPAEEGGENE